MATKSDGNNPDPGERFSLRITNLSKTFVGQRALASVDFDVRSGEIHALAGENGSGKSTLIKCVAGVHQADPGAFVEIGERSMGSTFSAADAAQAGAAFVHQNPGLLSSLTVMENFGLSRGFVTSRGGGIKWAHEARRTSDALERFGIKVDPRAEVHSLSAAQKTLVAIARSLADVPDGGLLVLDEPTASLPSAETQLLFAGLEETVAAGVGIVFVSHRLSEMLEVAQRVTVLRDGVRVGTWDANTLDEDLLVSHIIGQSIEKFYPEPASSPASRVVLSARHISGPGVENADLDLCAGEVVGIAGLLGSGRTELAKLIFGAERRTNGTVQVEGVDVPGRTPRDAINAGIALIPEDRRESGSHPTLTVAENVTLADSSAHFRGLRFRKRAERTEIHDLIDRFHVKPPDPGRALSTLSGGNQQKVVLAKWMRMNPKVLILDEPTQGVDVGAKSEIYALIEDAAERGAAVLIIDSDLDDLCRLCHRVIVMRRGSIVAELTGDEKTKGRALQLVHAKREEIAP